MASLNQALRDKNAELMRENQRLRDEIIELQELMHQEANHKQEVVNWCRIRISEVETYIDQLELIIEECDNDYDCMTSEGK